LRHGRDFRERRPAQRTLRRVEEAACSPPRQIRAAERTTTDEYQERENEMRRLLCLSVVCAIPAVSAAAEPWDLYDGAAGVSQGATCRYYNAGARISWWHPGGDWVDAAGKLWGTQAHGSAAIEAYQTGTVRINATKAFANGNRGLVLRRSGYNVNFYSAESGKGPRLLVTQSNGKVVTLQPRADAGMASVLQDPTRCASINPTGESARLSTTQAVVMEFPPLPAGFKSAMLELTIERAYGDTTMQVFALKKPRLPDSPVTTGFAARYPGDRGICSATGVLYCENWDTDPKNWWTRGGVEKANNSWITSNGVRFPARWSRVTFAPNEGYIGAGLRLTLPADGVYGTAVPTADFVGLGYGEQEHLFYRYYLKYSSEFRDATRCDGGKHPGLAGDTTIAGNGGSATDGTNGWSLRGGYIMNCDKNNPIYPRVVLSTYAYYADMVGDYGQHWAWTGKGDAGLAKLNEWVCIEGEVKVNTPGARNGVLRTWMNGRLAFEKTDVFLRKKPPYKIPGKLGIRKFWGTLHHGGTRPFGKNVSVWMDQTVVAKSRIGCIAG
jgi:hypothetical protein